MLMLTKEVNSGGNLIDFKARIKKVKGYLNKNKLEALLVTNLKNIHYLTGFTGSAGLLVIRNDGSKPLFLTDGRYLIQSQIETAASGVKVKVGKPQQQLRYIKSYIKGVQKLAVEQENITVGQLKGLSKFFSPVKLVDSKNILSLARIVKDEVEISYIAQACAIADGAFKNIKDLIRPGVSEKDLAIELDYQMRKLGALNSSFDTIVASGVNSALPHAKPSNKKLKPGEFVVFDFGALFQGYCSDMTRTYLVGGKKPTDKMKEIYQVVLDAQKYGLEVVSSGKKAFEVDLAARSVIKKRGFEKFFTHSTGHGVGLDIHEPPWIAPKIETILESNMTITVEPGVYIESLGGVRIEDTVVVTEGGCRILTNTEKGMELW